MPTPGIGTDPRWVHETIVLRIGERDYTFRTLALYDLWRLWPDLHAVKDMALRGRPLTMMEHAKKILEWIAPVLVANDADCKAFTQDHANILLDFYRRQDWARMATLGGETTKTEGDGNDKTEEEKHQVFVAIVAAGAKYAGMDVGAFVQQRFEFCADQIQAAYAAFRRAESEEAGAGADRPRADCWREVNQRLAQTFGVTPTAVPEEKLPEFMRVLNKQRVN